MKPIDYTETLSKIMDKLIMPNFDIEEYWIEENGPFKYLYLRCPYVRKGGGNVADMIVETRTLMEMIGLRNVLWTHDFGKTNFVLKLSGESQ